MSKFTNISAAFLLLAATPDPLTAAAAAPTAMPLELTQIFGPSAVTLDRPASMRWLVGGAAYSTLEKTAKDGDGMDVVRYDVASGKRSIVIHADALKPPGATKALALTDHEWSPDGHVALLTVAAAEARRNNPVSNCWLYDLRTKTLRQIGGKLAPGGLLHAEFSPDGRQIAFVSNNNLHVETIDGAGAVQLTSDGSDIVLNGRGDLAYEEEFALGKAFAWSPDSRRIAYWQFDTSGVGTFYLIRNTGGQYSSPIPLRYPKPGTTNSAVRVGVVSVDAPGTQWFALAGDPRDNYVPRMNWAGSHEVLLQYENRRQNTNSVLLGDIATGAVRPVMVEKDDAWLLPSDHVHWLDGGRAFTWLSERDGWMHLYTVSRDGTRVELRTPGAFDIVQIESIDTKSGYAYFSASPANVTQRYLYRATLSGRPETGAAHASGPARLARLRHRAGSEVGGSYVFHRRSTAHRRTRQPALARAPPGTHRQPGDARAAFRHPSRKNGVLQGRYRQRLGARCLDDQAAGLRCREEISAADVRVLRARRADSGRPLGRRSSPVASADGAARIPDCQRRQPRRRGAARAELAPLDLPADRYPGLGGPGGGDSPHDGRASVHRRLAHWCLGLERRRRHDAQRDVPLSRPVPSGIAIASPTDQMLYNSIYQERYMGLPAENPDGYRDGSPINFAQNLAGDLLIIHGTGDDNVHYQNAEQLVDRLIGLNKPFSMMAYPNRTHGIGEGANTRLHLFGLATRFLEEHLAREAMPHR